MWGVVTTTLAVRCEKWFRSHSDLLFGLFLFGSLIAFVAMVIIIAKRIASRNKVICPSCGNWMGEGKRMLETNKCSRCKSVIYQSP